MVTGTDIEELTPDFYALAAHWLSDPEINKWLYAEWREHPADERLIALAAHHPRNRLWIITVNGKPYGLCSIGNISKVDRSGVAWCLRGSGVKHVPAAMTTSLRKMLRVAFTDMQLRSVNASIMAPNMASRRMVERAGFREAGVLREGFALEGEFVDRILFDILPEDLE